MKGKLLSEIKDRLTSLPGVKKVEADVGQVEQIDTNQDKSVTLPNSVFVSFSEIIYRDTEVYGIQEGDLRVTVKCLSKSINRLTLDFDFVQDVYLSLQGFEGSFFTAFNRVSEPETFYKISYTISTIVFETTIEDTSFYDKQQENLTKVSPTLKVEKSNE